MNKTDKPIDTSKYPLINQFYNLVIEIDKLPASKEATNLVTKASDLMTEVWNYLEAQNTVGKVSQFLIEELEKKYLGMRIKSSFSNAIFVVENIESISDSQSIMLSSKKYKEELAKRQEIIKKIKFGETIYRPVEKVNLEECYMINNINDPLPKILN